VEVVGNVNVSGKTSADSLVSLVAMTEYLKADSIEAVYINAGDINVSNKLFANAIEGIKISADSVNADYLSIAGQKVVSSPFAEANNTLTYEGMISADSLESSVAITEYLQADSTETVYINTGGINVSDKLFANAIEGIKISADSVDADYLSIAGQKVVSSPFAEANNTLTYEGKISADSLESSVAITEYLQADSTEANYIAVNDLNVSNKITLNEIEAVKIASDSVDVAYLSIAGHKVISSPFTEAANTLTYEGKIITDSLAADFIDAGTILADSIAVESLTVNGRKVITESEANSIIYNGKFEADSVEAQVVVAELMVSDAMRADTVYSSVIAATEIFFTSSDNDVRLGSGAGADDTYSFRKGYNVFLGYKSGNSLDIPLGPYDENDRSLFVVNNQANIKNPLLYGYFANTSNHNNSSASVTQPAQLGINTTYLLDSMALTVSGGIAITSHNWSSSSVTGLSIKDKFGDFSLWTEQGIVSPAYFIGHSCMWDNDDADCPDNWGDFVFEDDYRLAPLNEVSEYVRKNKHLSGVPSADDIKENGYEVHGMNRNFIVKIEELTLYLIKQDEQISQQKKEIEQLKTQVAGYEYLASEVEMLKSILQPKKD
jgi:hypothetical protein